MTKPKYTFEQVLDVVKALKEELGDKRNPVYPFSPLRCEYYVPEDVLRDTCNEGAHQRCIMGEIAHRLGEEITHSGLAWRSLRSLDSYNEWFDVKTNHFLSDLQRGADMGRKQWSIVIDGTMIIYGVADPTIAID